MADLRVRFIERTRRDADVVRELRERWDLEGYGSTAVVKEIARTVHSLSGAAGVFGFNAISDAAHRAELGLLRFESGTEDPRVLLDALHKEMELLWAKQDAA
ncbi:MAG: Hpt domain-containing protein [Proteobacteria bacterium]|nr:Hpt domain-containing protein [Pseudomonadota bacterium]